MIILKIQEIEALPAIIHAAMDNIKGKLEVLCGAGEILLQSSIVNKSFEILRLYREATESVYEVVLCGRNLMRDLVNQVVDDTVQRAFNEEKYIINRMNLSNVEDHLNVTRERLEIAKVTLKTVLIQVMIVFWSL